MLVRLAAGLGVAVALCVGMGACSSTTKNEDESSGGGGGSTGATGGGSGTGGTASGGGGGLTGGGGAPMGGGGAPVGGGGAPVGGGGAPTCAEVSPPMDCSCSGAPTSDAGALDGGCLRCIDAIYLSIPAGDPRVCAGEQAIYKALRDCACQKCGAAGQACHQELCLPGLVGGDCEGCIASNCCAVEFKACNQ